MWAKQVCAAVKGMVFKQSSYKIGDINQSVWV